MDTTSWFTPTVLFFLVNLIILVIFLASYSKSHNPKPQLGHTNSPQLARSSSILARVKSFNFSFNRLDTHYPFHPETRFTDPLLNTETEVEVTNQVSEHHSRTPATTEDIPVKKSASKKTVNGREEKEEEVLGHRPETTGDIPVATMKKSASEKTVVEREEEAVVQRPATMRERKPRVIERAVSRTLSFKGDVDAKADDFINRFKQQLKLQKLDSIKRYTDMLSRGTGPTASNSN